MTESHRQGFRHGFVSLFPIWPGVISIALAYAVVSRSTGFSLMQIALLSTLVFSGAAQFAISSMVDNGATTLTIIGTVALLNLRNVMYGMSSMRWLPRDSPPKVVLAHCLVDESFGLAEREAVAGRASGWFLFGAGISLYAAWNCSGAAGLILDQFIAIPTDMGLDFIFPLSFVALTVPLLRNRPHVLAATVAAIVTLGASRFMSSGLAIFSATIAAIAVGELLEPRDGR